jgi:hypothetical protein
VVISNGIELEHPQQTLSCPDDRVAKIQDCDWKKSFPAITYWQNFSTHYWAMVCKFISKAHLCYLQDARSIDVFASKTFSIIVVVVHVWIFVVPHHCNKQSRIGWPLLLVRVALMAI